MGEVKPRHSDICEEFALFGQYCICGQGIEHAHEWVKASSMKPGSDRLVCFLCGKMGVSRPREA